MFASDSVATRQSIIFTEKLPEAILETVRATDVIRGAATRVADCAGEISTSEVTHLFEV